MTILFCDLVEIDEAGPSASIRRRSSVVLAPLLRRRERRSSSVTAAPSRSSSATPSCAVFGMPTVQEDDALRGVTSGRRAPRGRGQPRRPGSARVKLATRIGVNPGEVFAAGTDLAVAGDAVWNRRNVWRRLHRATGFCIGPTTWALVGSEVDAEATAAGAAERETGADRRLPVLNELAAGRSPGRPAGSTPRSSDAPARSPSCRAALAEAEQLAGTAAGDAPAGRRGSERRASSASWPSGLRTPACSPAAACPTETGSRTGPWSRWCGARPGLGRRRAGGRRPGPAREARRGGNRRRPDRRRRGSRDGTSEARRLRAEIFRRGAALPGVARPRAAAHRRRRRSPVGRARLLVTSSSTSRARAGDASLVLCCLARPSSSRNGRGDWGRGRGRSSSSRCPAEGNTRC